MANGKGIVLYDFLLVRGGAERLTLTLVRNLEDVGLCVGYRARDSFPDSDLEGIELTELVAATHIAGWRSIKSMRSFRNQTKFLSEYDWVIYSGTNAPLAVHNHPHGPNILYCHTLPRFVYDLREYYLERYPRLLRPALKALMAYVKPRYEAAVERMDLIIVNSENVRRRMQHYLNLDSIVISPPCDTDKFVWQGQSNYYLSPARLESFKRVDVIVEAFRRMPDKRLIVVSGGLELAKLRRLAAGAPNIEFVGWVGDAQLQALLGNAIATIYVPKDEDFGMSPVESMAAGKPVIGVAEGGLLETVVDGATGIMLAPDPGFEQVMAAVRLMTPERALQMRGACEQRAALFSRELFVRRMRAAIDSVRYRAAPEQSPVHVSPHQASILARAPVQPDGNNRRAGLGAKNTVVVHDFFSARGGGERLVLDLALGLNLELCFAFWTEECYSRNEVRKLKTWDLNAYTSLPGWRTLKEMRAFKTNTGFLRDYQTVIYSGDCAPLAVINHPHGRNIFYCHTPPRIIYDQKHFFLDLLPSWQRPILTGLADYLQPQYEAAISKMDLVIANSDNVRNRIRKCLGIDSTVVYPPIDTEGFRWLSQGDYYISLARAEPLKRVAEIVRAFMRMPEKKLIVASGGSHLNRLRRMAQGAPNIRFTGWTSNAELRTLTGNALAAIYIPIEEDFGMSPVESMAAGKPVIGVAEGGLLETIVHGETGILLGPNPGPDNVIEAVRIMTAERASQMRYACERRAALFSRDRFLRRMREVIEAGGRG